MEFIFETIDKWLLKKALNYILSRRRDFSQEFLEIIYKDGTLILRYPNKEIYRGSFDYERNFWAIIYKTKGELVERMANEIGNLLDSLIKDLNGFGRWTGTGELNFSYDTKRVLRNKREFERIFSRIVNYWRRCLTNYFKKILPEYINILASKKKLGIGNLKDIYNYLNMNVISYIINISSKIDEVLNDIKFKREIFGKIGKKKNVLISMNIGGNFYDVIEHKGKYFVMINLKEIKDLYDLNNPDFWDTLYKIREILREFLK